MIAYFSVILATAAIVVINIVTVSGYNPLICKQLPFIPFTPTRFMVVSSTQWTQLSVSNSTFFHGASYVFTATARVPSCKVELKFESFYGFAVVVDPRGRANSTDRYEATETDSYNVCLGNTRGSTFLLGKSIVSFGPEVMLSFMSIDYPTSPLYQFALVYRANCGQEISKGFELPPASTEGKVSIISTSDLGSNMFTYSDTCLGRFWTIKPVAGCSLKLNLKEISRGLRSDHTITVNGRIFLNIGPTFRTNVSQPLEIFQEYRSPGSNVNLTFAYSAECPGSNTAAMLDFGESLKLLPEATNEWQSFQSETKLWRQYETRILALPLLTNQEVLLKVSSPYPPKLPVCLAFGGRQFDTCNLNSLTIIQSEMATFWPNHLTLFEVFDKLDTVANSIGLSYRAKPTAVSRIVVHSETSWSTLEIDANSSSFHISLEAIDKDCLIQFERMSSSNSRTFVHPLGLNIPAFYEVNNNNYKIISRGPSFGIRVILKYELSQLFLANKLLTARYRMSCPVRLQSATEKWKHVTLGTLNNAFVIGQSECPKRIVQTSFTEDGTSACLRISCTGSPSVSSLDYRLDSVSVNCTGSILITCETFYLPSRFAYRSVCSRTTPIAELFPSIGVLFKASQAWQTISITRGMVGGTSDPKAWTVKADSPKCRLEFHFDVITSEFVGIQEALGSHFSRYPSTIGLQHVNDFRYLSCTRQVYFMEIPDARLSHYPNQVLYGQYRQVCGPRATAHACTLDRRVNASGEWQTLEFKAVNFNHVRNSGVLIQKSASSRFLEIRFISVVQQTQWSYTHAFRGPYDTSETLGVYIQGERAMTGKSYIYEGTSVNVRADTFNVKQGSHVFTLKYRELNTTEDTPYDTTELTATRRIQSLKLKVPSQFSDEKRASINARAGNSDPYSFPALQFQSWAYMNSWSIQAENSSCQVAVRFTKMDIGCGYIAGKRSHYRNDQHRLFVTRSKTPVKSWWCTGTGDPRCARLDTTYLSKGHTIQVFFQSTTILGEYEYDKDANYYADQIKHERGAETTWGSGWEAEYWQVCEPHEAVKGPWQMTISVHSRQWKSDFPGMPSGSVSLFRHLRWILIPSDPACLVEFAAEMRNYETWDFDEASIPFRVYDESGTKQTWQSDDYGEEGYLRFESSSITLEALGMNNRKRSQSKLQYRLLC